MCSEIINDLTLEEANTVTGIGLTCTLDNIVCEREIRADKIELSVNDDVITEHMDMEFFQEDDKKVCRLGFISLKPEHKRHQIMKKLHERQLQVLSDNAFKQMQLTATLDGLVVWPLLFFQFEESDFKEMWVSEVFTYMTDVLGYNTKKAKQLSNANVHDIASLLKPEDKVWFTQWVKHGMALRMYKDIR